MDSHRSMLDVVQEGLRVANRITFIHRIQYIGGHKLGRGKLEDVMKGIVAAQAEQHSDEPLTGYLLYYEAHFLHFVEGSEGTLTKHLRAVTDTTLKESSQIGTIKIVEETTHINKRLFTSWAARFAVPPTLAQSLTHPMSPVEVAHLVDNMMSKTQKLGDILRHLAPGASLGQQAALLLPEAELLEFLLGSPHLLDARQLLQEHDRPPAITLYDDEVWPAQTDYVPYDVFNATLQDDREIVEEEASS